MRCLESAPHYWLGSSTRERERNNMSIVLNPPSAHLANGDFG